MSSTKPYDLAAKGTEGFKPDMKDISWSTPSVTRSVIVRVPNAIREGNGFSEEQIIAIRKACRG